MHKDIADEFVPRLAERLFKHKVEIRGDETSRLIEPQINEATDEDYGTEYLDYIVSLKIVSGTDEAIAHINEYNTGHSETIVTNDYANSQKFLDEVDAAAVYVNASYGTCGSYDHQVYNLRQRTDKGVEVFGTPAFGCFTQFVILV